MLEVLFAIIIGLVFVLAGTCLLWYLCFMPFFRWVEILPEEDQEQVLRDFNNELLRFGDQP